MILHREGDRFVLECTYGDRSTPKEARFHWDPKAKQWWTNQPERAACLIDYADEACQAVLVEARQQHEEALKASRATDALLEVPVPVGLEFMPFQLAGIAFAQGKAGVLLADEMGLGKTIQALGMVNADPKIERVLVVCPASLRLNWQREAEKWLVRPFAVTIAQGSDFPEAPSPWMQVINYDILKRHHDRLRADEWDMLILDECHYLKNSRAQRTQEVLGKRNKSGWRLSPIPARRKVFLTGTPIVNRPVELWPIVNGLDPERWPSFWNYAQRYCGAKYNGYGWDFRGASNLPELQDILRSTVMVRRLKAEVLSDLPAKRRQVLELPANGNQSLVQEEREAFELHQSRAAELTALVEISQASENPADYQEAVETLRAEVGVAFSEISQLRHNTAVAKIPAVLEHVIQAVGGSGQVVVFAHHQDVVDGLRSGLEEAGIASVSFAGRDTIKARDEAVRSFQESSVAVFIGSIQAAGVGLTLTAASHVVFAELDWVPGNMTQAEDRCHRIGQADSVLVQHVVLAGSLDAQMAHTLIAKQAVIDQALDTGQACERMEEAS
jgi:SWI/SNF-related matrix-associated actin-dependent regulator 1 of chromatin subfamily A